AYTGYLMLLGFLGYRLHLYQKARTLEKAQQAAKEKELEQAREIKKAYAELKATQDQLIHSEKMASLGELTAGIAHEIQNPLNFVNNFAEVNRELIDELKEESGKETKDRNAKLEQDLLEDIDQNLDKISLHGKRADSIVKGMLQHSRSGDGKKEPTDLNKLADEYLRLAYHGLRAKDKSFNAAMETDFDPELPRVDVVPQDIGRVLLNLLTNAFHAVSQHKDIAQKGYEPTVWIKTKKAKNGVEITVEDNGGGIPAAIREKIFQPFFTTKSTGEGTGLGLSMSYDIVTKGHGGQLNLESKEGEGAKFFVTLPV
ncbi:MAG: ATP-binding protein, partial [Robiginitalea sp.]